MKNLCFRFASAVLIASALFLPFGMASTAAQYHKITPQEAKVRIEQNSRIVIVDVRTPEEYAAGHIPNAVSLPSAEIDARSDAVSRILPDKDAEILVYCRTGIRSSRASGELAALGYTRIYDIGGIVNWPYEIIR